MVELIVSTLMWALVLVLVIFRRARKERSVLYAAVTIAITMMLNDDDLYFVVDSWFGGRDIAHLISALTLMIGVYYLAQGISRAGVQRYLSGLPSQILLLVAVAVTAVSFFMVPHKGVTTTSFMSEYGDYLAAAVYTCTQYVYFIVIFSALSATAIATMREGRLVREKVAGALLLAGSICTIALSVDVIGMNVAHQVYGVAAITPWRDAYYLLQVGTFLFLTVGLAIAPIARWVTETRRERAISRYLEMVTPLWEEATTKRPTPNLEKATSTSAGRLYRRIVEVRDAARDTNTVFALTAEDKALLAKAEEQLATGGAR